MYILQIFAKLEKKSTHKIYTDRPAAKVDFLNTVDEKAEQEIPLSPTEEEYEKPKDHTMRNIALVGGIVALGVIAWYFSKKKE